MSSNFPSFLYWFSYLIDWNIWGFPCRKWCHLQLETFVLPIFQVKYLLFAFLSSLVWLVVPVRYWQDCKPEHPCSQSQRRAAQLFSTKCCGDYGLDESAFAHPVTMGPFLTHWDYFIMKGLKFCQMLFDICWSEYIIFLCYANVLYHT